MLYLKIVLTFLPIITSQRIDIFQDKVFVGRRPYDEAPFESFLKRELGENKTMASLPEKPTGDVFSGLRNK